MSRHGVHHRWQWQLTWQQVLRAVVMRPAAVRQCNALLVKPALLVLPSFVVTTSSEEWTKLAMNPHSFSIASTLTWLSKCCRTLHSVSLEVLYLDETSYTSTGPFFIFLFPVFFFFQGNKLEHPSILVSFAYFLLVSLFCASSPTIIHWSPTHLPFRVYQMVL